jgi:hypothetical protein
MIDQISSMAAPITADPPPQRPGFVVTALIGEDSCKSGGLGIWARSVQQFLRVGCACPNERGRTCWSAFFELNGSYHRLG